MRIALFDFRQTVDYRLEILSGLTVAMALIPEAVAQPLRGPDLQGADGPNVRPALGVCKFAPNAS